MQRRSLLKRGAALAAASQLPGLLWAPPLYGNQGTTGHDPYFAKLNALLKQHGPGRPVMILDRARIDHNIDALTASVGPDKRYRVVVKSLPSVPLLQHVMTRAKTDALMVFHQPFLNAVATAFPSADVLMGKPMPVAAARTFYRTRGDSQFSPDGQLQWLIDSRERLLQYQSMAREFGIRIGVNFEIDVGLRRGGLAEPAELHALLDIVAADPQHLRVTGLMGYEPHLTGLKATLDHPAVQQVLGTYRGFVDTLKAGGLDPEQLTLNGAGSHTLRIYERDRLMNDLSAGSGVVKPTDFDTWHLDENRPALFIATPILKRYDANPVMPNPPKSLERLFYIYGGKWKAKMVSPNNTGEPIYESTNQSPITTPASVDLRVDDYMFLRPTQSEFVMLQFGDLLLFDRGELTERWPVFHETG